MKVDVCEEWDYEGLMLAPHAGIVGLTSFSKGKEVLC